MIVYRIIHKSLTNLVSGSGRETRWSAPGRKLIYTSSSPALCCLENLLRISGSANTKDFRTIFYEIPAGMVADEIKLSSLKRNWKLRSSYPDCQSAAADWFSKMDSLVLKAPSAMLTDEYNYIIKFRDSLPEGIKVINQQAFLPDHRLEVMPII
jgi:RES domain-containing protein